MFEKLFKIFEEDGKKLYHVGGSVRDKLLGLIPKDYDFTTDALPEETQRILTQANISHWPLGEKFGTIAAKVDNLEVEITTHRKDMTSGRHPDVVFTKNLKSDLARRDFTINSMAMDSKGTLIDPFGGFKDLHRKVIRATGEPKERFAEDPLRMLRAVRFVSKLGFRLSSKSLNVIKLYVQSIMSVSKERQLEEMNKLLLGDYVCDALNMLKVSRLLNYVLPELHCLAIPNTSKTRSKDLWYHTLTVVSKTPPQLSLRWAALLHDIAKPQTIVETPKEVHFFQHEILGAELTEGILGRLKMGKNLSRKIINLISLHHRIINVVSRKNDPPVSISGLRRVIRDCEFCSIDELIDLFYADCSSNRAATIERQGEHTKLLRQAVKELREEELKPKLPSGIGNEIMRRFNLSPCKEVGEIKKELDELLLDGKINSSMCFDEIFEQLKGGRDVSTTER